VIDLIDLGRKFAVFFRNRVSRIVRAEGNVNFIVGIAPGGMMVHFFGYKSHFGHEAEGLDEITELKAANKPVVFFCPHSVRRLVDLKLLKIQVERDAN
jgi:hypothetical protein